LPVDHLSLIDEDRARLIKLARPCVAAWYLWHVPSLPGCSKKK
jgi:hypothetical protein